MRTFRMNKWVHIFNLFSIVLCLATFLLPKLGFETVVAIPIALTFLAGFNFVNMVFTKYIIDCNSIVYKTLISRTEIEWNDADCILELPAGSVEKVSVGLISKQKRIVITALVNNYRELVLMMVNEVEKREVIEMDPRVKLISKEFSMK